MALFIVRLRNNYFPPGTYLELDDAGFVKVKVSTVDGKLVVVARDTVVIPWNKEISEACFQLGKPLPPSVVAKIREDFNK